MNTGTVDDFLRDGCGRCAQYQTPACKALAWTAPLTALRALLRASGLTEALKWGSPCYTLDGKNVAMLAAFRAHCALSFFKGAALEDPEGLLEPAGPNSRHARLLRFQSRGDVSRHRDAIRRLLAQAIALERSGVKVAPGPAPLTLPDELARRLAVDAPLRRAFEALTPGRRRSHALYVGGATQSATRERRVDRCAGDILQGRGFNER